MSIKACSETKITSVLLHEISKELIKEKFPKVGHSMKLLVNISINSINPFKLKFLQYLGRFKWIVRRKMNCNKKNTACIRTISGTHYCCLPMKHVLCNWAYSE